MAGPASALPSRAAPLSSIDSRPVFPLSSTELGRLERFSTRGGIGQAVASEDVEAMEPNDLMFMQGDSIIVLHKFDNDEFLGYCEGIIGRFKGSQVKFSTKLKKAVTRMSSAPTSASSASSRVPPPPSSSAEVGDVNGAQEWSARRSVSLDEGQRSGTVEKENQRSVEAIVRGKTREDGDGVAIGLGRPKELSISESDRRCSAVVQKLTRVQLDSPDQPQKAAVALSPEPFSPYLALPPQSPTKPQREAAIYAATAPFTPPSAVKRGPRSTPPPISIPPLTTTQPNPLLRSQFSDASLSEAHHTQWSTQSSINDRMSSPDRFSKSSTPSTGSPGGSPSPWNKVEENDTELFILDSYRYSRRMSIAPTSPQPGSPPRAIKASNRMTFVMANSNDVNLAMHQFGALQEVDEKETNEVMEMDTPIKKGGEVASKLRGRLAAGLTVETRTLPSVSLPIRSPGASDDTLVRGVTTLHDVFSSSPGKDSVRSHQSRESIYPVRKDSLPSANPSPTSATSSQNRRNFPQPYFSPPGPGDSAPRSRAVLGLPESPLASPPDSIERSRTVFNGVCEPPLGPPLFTHSSQPAWRNLDTRVEEPRTDWTAPPSPKVVIHEIPMPQRPSGARPSPSPIQATPSSSPISYRRRPSTNSPSAPSLALPSSPGLVPSPSATSFASFTSSHASHASIDSAGRPITPTSSNAVHRSKSSPSLRELRSSSIGSSGGKKSPSRKNSTSHLLLRAGFPLGLSLQATSTGFQSANDPASVRFHQELQNQQIEASRSQESLVTEESTGNTASTGHKATGPSSGPSSPAGRGKGKFTFGKQKTGGSPKGEPKRKVEYGPAISHKDFQEQTVQAGNTDFEMVKPLEIRTLLEKLEREKAQEQEPEEDDNLPPSRGASLHQSSLSVDYNALHSSSAVSLARLGSTHGSRGLANAPSISVEVHRTNELTWIKCMTSLAPAAVKKSNKMKALVQAGIPSSVRGRVWAYLSEADEEKVEGLFHMLAGLESPISEHDRIDDDISRTFLDNPVFSMGSTGRDDLSNVLRALHHYDGSLGFGPGMSHVVGLLLTHVASAEEAFWILTALVKRYGMRAFFEKGRDILAVQTQAFALILESVDSTLAKRFADLQIHPHDFLPAWTSTLFVTVLPLAAVLRIADLFFIDPNSSIRVALAILELLRPRLLNPQLCPTREGTLALLSSPTGLSLTTLMPTVFSIKVKDEAVRKAVKKAESAGGGQEKVNRVMRRKSSQSH